MEKTYSITDTACNTGTKTKERKYVVGKEKAAFGIAAVGSYMIANVVASYFSYFLTDILIVSPLFVTILMTFARFWDMVNDPIMGVLIDRTNTKRGKMRPYIRIGSFLIFFISLFMFLPVSDAHPTVKMIFATLMYLGFDMAYTIVDVPAMGLMSVATPSRNERASLLSFYVTIGSVGSLLPIVMVPILQSFLPETLVYFVMSVTVGVFVLIGYFFLYRKSRERFSSSTEKIKVKDMFRIAFKNKPMLLTLLTSMLASPRYLLMLAAAYISTYVIIIPPLNSGTVMLILYLVIGGGMVTGILATPPLYKKIGYKKTCIIAGILGAISLGCAFFAGKISYFAALPFMTVGGLAIGAYNVLPYPMVGDSLDYLEWKTGQRMEGVCFSLNSFVTKFNNAAGAILLSAGLVVFKFVQPVESGVPLPQSEYTLTGLYSLVTLIPAVGFLLSVIPMALNTYTGSRKKEILAVLQERRKSQNICSGIACEQEDNSSESLIGSDMEINCDYNEITLQGDLRLGVLSDSQLSPFALRKNNTFERNLKKAFELLREQNCNVIIFAGDICNIASRHAYARFNAAFNDTFKDGNKPVLLPIMGNHDYFVRIGNNEKKRRMFEKYTGHKPYFSYKINGMSFIGVSPDCASLKNGYLKVLPWLKQELDKAVSKNDNAPVFVITHNCAKNTVYGSEDWGDTSLASVLNNYPSVVNIAGHLHYPMLDERSIHQKYYTTVNSQSTAYVEMEKGKSNGSVPPDAHLGSAVQVWLFNDDGIQIRRYLVNDGSEQKSNMRWHLPARLTEDSFTYTDSARRKSAGTPVMNAAEGRAVLSGNRTYLVFGRGSDDDFVHSYKVVYEGGATQYYFSDFTKCLNCTDKNICIELYGMPRGTYSATVYAVNSQGIESLQGIKIENIKITKKRRYPLVFAPDARYL